MVRIKNRWLLVEFLNPDLEAALAPITPSKIYHGVKNSVINNFGDAGWGSVGVSLSVKYYSATTCLCIIRVGREHLPIVRAAVTLLTAVDSHAVIPVVIHCSGTIKKIQQAAIEHNRLTVARFRGRAYHQSEEDRTIQDDRTAEAYLESSTKDIEGLQD